MQYLCICVTKNVETKKATFYNGFFTKKRESVIKICNYVLIKYIIFFSMYDKILNYIFIFLLETFLAVYKQNITIEITNFR